MVNEQAVLVWEQEADTVRPNWMALALLMLTATLVGVLPYALYVDRFAAVIMLAAALAAVLMAVRRLRKFKTRATDAPSLGEYLLGGWNAVAYSAFAGLLGIAAFAATAFLVKWLGRLVGWLGGDWRPLAPAWGLWVSLVVVALLGLVCMDLIADEVFRRLYPNTAGARSPFYSLLLERQRLFKMLVVALVALLALVAIFRPPGRPFAVAIALYLFYTGAVLEQMGKEAGDAPQKQRIVDLLRKLLGGIGYETILAPRTGSSEIDPLIAGVDLLAHSPEGSLAVEVKAPKRQLREVGWHEASRLQTAAAALSDALERGSSASGPVEPLLVLAGRRRAASLDRFLEDEPMQIVELQGTGWLERLEAAETREQLEALAEEVDLEPVEGYPVAAPQQPTESSA